MKIIVPADKLAAAVNQYLIPGWIRKHSQVVSNKPVENNVTQVANN
jgi:hypothetical protein